MVKIWSQIFVMSDTEINLELDNLGTLRILPPSPIWGQTVQPFLFQLLKGLCKSSSYAQNPLKCIGVIYYINLQRIQRSYYVFFLGHVSSKAELRLPKQTHQTGYSRKSMPQNLNFNKIHFCFWTHIEIEAPPYKGHQFASSSIVPTLAPSIGPGEVWFPF